MSTIIGAVKILFGNLMCKIEANKYARRIGVVLGNNVRFYGMSVKTFDMDPWMVTIGENCKISNGCRFVTHDGSAMILRNKIPDLEYAAPIHLGKNTYLGMEALLLPGTVLGENCIVGARAVVKGVFPDNCVIAGVPAKIIMTLDEYESKMIKKSTHTGHLRGEERRSKLRALYSAEAIK